jgi:hypothetical protein
LLGEWYANAPIAKTRILRVSAFIRRLPAHPASPSGSERSTPIAPPALPPLRDRALAVTPLAAGEPARSPAFLRQLPSSPQFKIALRSSASRWPQATHIVRLKAAKAFAPGVDRLFRDASTPLRWLAIRLADDRHNLLFREVALPHCTLRIGSQSLKLVVRKFCGKSVPTEKEKEHA